MKILTIITGTFLVSIYYWLRILWVGLIATIILTLLSWGASSAFRNRTGSFASDGKAFGLFDKETFGFIIGNAIDFGLIVGGIALLVTPFFAYRYAVKETEKEEAEKILKKEEDEKIQSGIEAILKTLKKEGKLEGSTTLIMKRIEQLADLSNGDLLIEHKKFIEKKIKELKE